MRFLLFEGPAGTGKTQNVIESARGLLAEGVLEDRHRILALTFMNGSRRRLQHRLAQYREFRRRYECLTFDSFARGLVARRQSRVRSGGLAAHGHGLNEFDGPCRVAGALLERHDDVSKWVGASFPIVLVDEAQDLDDCRIPILRGLATSCHVIVGADAFQCLSDGRDTDALMGWLTGRGEAARLTEPMRTSKAGLLAVATALRDGRAVLTELTRSERTRSPTWNGNGVTIVESPANNAGIIAWNISNQIRRCGRGRTVILTPDARTPRILEALEQVGTREFSNNLGPFPFIWERKEDQVAQDLLSEVELPEHGKLDELRAAFGALSANATGGHDNPRSEEPGVPECGGAMAAVGHGQRRA